MLKLSGYLDEHESWWGFSMCLNASKRVLCMHYYKPPQLSGELFGRLFRQEEAWVLCTDNTMTTIVQWVGYKYGVWLLGLNWIPGQNAEYLSLEQRISFAFPAAVFKIISTLFLFFGTKSFIELPSIVEIGSQIKCFLVFRKKTTCVKT